MPNSYVTIVIAFSFLSVSPEAKVNPDEARYMLKDYALIHCLQAIDPQSELGRDLAIAQHALSFMGRGMYTVLQDENTLEVIHDPYEIARENMLAMSNENVSSMKDGSTSRSLSCFKVYHSNEFNELVDLQQSYLMATSATPYLSMPSTILL